MKTRLPTDCGNAPRIQIVSDFIVNWAEGNTDAVSEWITDDTSWTVIGSETFTGTEAVNGAGPNFSPTHLEVTAVITHGRLASCNGFISAANQRIHFSHVFRFSSTSKTAKIAEVQSYYIS